MCEPVSVMTAVSLGATAVSGVMGASAAGKNAKAEQAQLRAQADTQRTNAALARTNGDAALSMAEINSTIALRVANNQSETLGNLAGLNLQVANASASAMEGDAALIEGTAKLNADTLEGQAQDTYAAGQAKAQGVQLQAGSLKGSQRAALAANGVTLDEGSSLRILTSTDVMADRTVDAIHLQAIKDAMGFRTAAVSQTLTAKMEAFNKRSNATLTRSAGAAGVVQASMDAENMKLGAQTDVLNLRQQAETEAQNARLQALSLTNGANAAEKSASAIKPGMAVATSLLGTAASVASKWYSASSVGAIGGGSMSKGFSSFSNAPWTA